MKLDHDAVVSHYTSGKTAAEVKDLCGCSLASVYNVLKAREVPLRPLYRHQSGRGPAICDHEFFSRPSESSAYWAGFLLADGNVHENRVTLCLAGVDYPHVQRFLDDVGSPNKVRIYTQPASRGLSSDKETEACRSAVRSDQMARDLASYGVVPAKSLTADPNLNHLPPDLHRHFWRGVVDGDGYSHVHESQQASGRYQLRATVGLTGSEKTIDKFADFCYAVSGKRPRVEPKGTIFRAQVSSHHGFRSVVTELYQDATVFLPRKKTKNMTILEELTRYEQRDPDTYRLSGVCKPSGGFRA